MVFEELDGRAAGVTCKGDRWELSKSKTLQHYTIHQA